LVGDNTIRARVANAVLGNIWGVPSGTSSDYSKWLVEEGEEDSEESRRAFNEQLVRGL
jgi:hypothetical protein